MQEVGTQIRNKVERMTHRLNSYVHSMSTKNLPFVMHFRYDTNDDIHEPSYLYSFPLRTPYKEIRWFTRNYIFIDITIDSTIEL